MVRAYRSTPVAVENRGFPGSDGTQWRQHVVQDELMTSFGTNLSTLSAITSGALAHVGYVGYAGAEDYDAPGSDPIGVDSTTIRPPLLPVNPSGRAHLVP